ncbi:MAG TPA: DUF6766 family protein, partial [Gemmatimonadales bacterium]|nr:DUF6766 family protein [Gemmatimonadales bacterium]
MAQGQVAHRPRVRQRAVARPSGIRRVLRENGLSIVLLTLFLLFLIGQSITGMLEYNQDQLEHGQRAVRYLQYLGSAHFAEAVAENWESEFLQIFAYVIFTAFLYQKGSAESKKPDEEEPVDRDPRQSRDKPGVPWPVRRGGLWLRLYEHSLSLAFLLLFFISVTAHAIGGAGEYNQEQAAHGSHQVTVLGYMGTARFWFESFQNWQSEFLALAAMV